MPRAWKTVYSALAPRGRKAKLFTFIFHRVLDVPDPLLPSEPSVQQFEWMMRFIAENFTVLRLDEAASRLAADELPSAAACITFDDGYRDNLELALPVLQRHGLVGTFFIATAFLDGGRMWNDDVIEAVRALGSGRAEWSEFGLGSHSLATPADRLRCLSVVLPKLKYFEHDRREEVARLIARRSGLPERSSLMMDGEQVRLLAAAGMEIGAHTHTHPILSLLGEERVCQEIDRGRSELERITGKRARVLAYPNGNTRRDLSARDAALVKDMGFVAAVTTDCGVADRATDHFLLPRFTPWDRTRARFGLRCALVLAGRM